MTQKGFAPIFLIVAILAVVVGVGFSKFTGITGQNKGPEQNQPGWGQRPGGAENFGPSMPPKIAHWSGPIPNPPKDKITFYKGLWSGNLIYPEQYTGLKLDLEKYKSWGVNIVNIAPGFEINSKGEVRYPPDFPTNEDLDARVGELATKFYSANIHLTMTVLVHYKENFDPKGQWAGEPIPLPKEVVEKPGYLDKFDKVVEDMAKIAQKYHIEMFAPMGEPENIFGIKVASSWNQEILPKIRKNYQGKIFYKGDLHKGEGDNLNFKGYDVLGVMPHPAPPPTDLEELRKVIDFNMDKASAWAKRDVVPEVVVAEHGYKGNNEMWPAGDIGIVLEEGSKKLNGVYLSDPMPAVLKTTNGEQIIAQMKKWFLN
ncbi:MAG: hypothetical protein PHE48_03775 [Candidatus Daviesbacteria bacterium]|nr:hypothetical protein [Candidatus Daviesbacteria bacterium]